ncbi:MAG: hypothetical protein INR64_07545 [Caulobacteraceae bacterium]|nr:hypothetical protein [Caulobacter sp.]
MARRARRGAEEESESYFVSLSDLMAGVLFLFIIMLTYFGLELRKTADAVSEHKTPVAAKAAPKPTPVAAPPTPATPPPEDLRTALLQRLQLLLLQAHSPATVDIAAGVVRIPNGVVFGGSDQVSPQGQATLAGVAGALMQVLPCASTGPGAPQPEYCPSGPGRLAGVNLEGHAGVGADSLTRSAVQAAAAYRGLTAAQPALGNLHSDPHGGGPPLIAVVGYAAGAATAATTSNAVEIRLYTTQ